MATKVKVKPLANGVPAPAPEVLTLAEAAAFLRVAEDAVRVELECGRLGGRQLAGEWRVGKEALLRWLDAPAPLPPLTGADLVAHARRVKTRYGFTETDEEVEAFLAAVRANRQVGK